MEEEEPLSGSEVIAPLWARRKLKQIPPLGCCCCNKDKYGWTCPWPRFKDVVDEQMAKQTKPVWSVVEVKRKQEQGESR